MKELIEELKNNQKIDDTDFVRIEYIIERLEDIEKDLESYLNDRINFLDSMMNYSIRDKKEDSVIYEYSIRKFEIENVKEYIEGDLIKNDK